MSVEGRILPGWVAYAALGVGVVCIGFSAIFVKLAAVPGLVSAFYRIFFAALVVIPWHLRKHKPLPEKKEILWILAGGLFFALDLAFWNSSLMLTSAPSATLLANNAPLWVGIGALILFHEKLSRQFWIGLAFSLAGMAVIVGGDAWQQLHFDPGQLLAIGSSIFYAAYLLATQRARAKVDTLTFMALSLLVCGLVLLGANIIFRTLLTGFSGKTWLALIGLGLLSQLVGWLAINYALGHLRAAPVSVSLLGQVIVTTLLAMPILGEYLSLNQLSGGVLVLTGIYLVNTREKAT